MDAFVRSCIICQKVKYDRQKTPGLLRQLPILDRPWESTYMDLVFQLPHSSQGNTGIWMIVDQFSKQAHCQEDYQSTPYGNPFYFQHF